MEYFFYICINEAIFPVYTIDVILHLYVIYNLKKR